jgi:hypothetical protein
VSYSRQVTHFFANRCPSWENEQSAAVPDFLW